MKVFFDDKSFLEDLGKIVESLEKRNNPLVVLPSEKDVRLAIKKFGDHVTFISYDYWLSKKWIADGDYDNIDFFRIDQFFIQRSYGVRVGIGTIKRVSPRIVEEKGEE